MLGQSFQENLHPQKRLQAQHQVHAAQLDSQRRASPDNRIEAFGVPGTEDIRRLRLELDRLLHTPPVDEEVARQKAMELAVLTLISVQMEEYEAHRLRSIFGQRSKMTELDAELLRQGVQSVECQGDDVRVRLKNGQCLEA